MTPTPRTALEALYDLPRWTVKRDGVFADVIWLNDAVAAIAAQAAAPDALREATYNALTRWINHDRDCPGRFGGDNKCICGLNAAHAVLTAPAVPAAIDPERLARAGDAVAERFGWVPYDATEWGITDDAYWQAIAAAYTADERL